MNSRDAEQSFAGSFDAGQAALAQGNWEQARDYFAAALQHRETPEAHEGLGLAAWWMDDATATFAARERAYQLYREQDNRRGAARVAIYLGYDYYSFRGEYAVANGWFQRAHRLLEDLAPVPEQGLLAVFKSHMALMVHHDAPGAQHLSAQAASLGRKLGVIDLEMLSVAYEGFAMVCQGLVSAGMRRLDEAMLAAATGEMTDLDATCTACCCFIYACERVRDYDRAAQWCEYMRDMTTRWRYPMMFSYCRMHYAGVLIWRGEWAEAETMLQAATSDLIASRPTEAADGLLRLAGLRRRQGRLADAERLIVQAETHPFRVLGSNLALLERAAIALEQEDAVAAAALAERFLRGLPPENRADRMPAIELLVQVYSACGNRTQAQAALAELEAIAEQIATEPLRAAAKFSAGIVAFARADYAAACRHFEDAVDLYKQSGTPFETARARFELARTLLALGHPQAARRHLEAARLALLRLGAAHQLERADTLIRVIETAPEERNAAAGNSADLTPREQEVLALIAAGKSNQEIARELVLSVRTVERHISNIYDKVGVSGKTARVAATAYALQRGRSLST